MYTTYHQARHRQGNRQSNSLQTEAVDSSVVIANTQQLAEDLDAEMNGLLKQIEAQEVASESLESKLIELSDALASARQVKKRTRSKTCR